MRAYVDLIATLSIQDATQAAEDAEPGSAAAAFATYWAAYSQAHLDSGLDLSEYAMSVTEMAGGYTMCAADDSCTEVTDAVQSKTGKVEDFKIDGTPASEVITLGPQQPEPLGDGEVRMIAAHFTTGGDTRIVLEVRSGATPLSLSYVSNYRAPDGRVSEDTDIVRPSELPANSVANVAVTFAGAAFGGELTYRVYADTDAARELTATFSTK